MPQPQCSLTREEVRRVDQLVMERLGVPGLLLMENAGRQVADAVVALLREQAAAAGSVVVVAGGGNNGGDGFVCARHLLVRGVPCVMILLQPPESYIGDAAANLRFLQALRGAGILPAQRGMGVPPMCLEGVSPSQTLDSRQNMPVAAERERDALETHGRDAHATLWDAHATLLRGASVIVDAIGGTGVVGPLRPALAAAVTACNDAGRPIVAVDIPTGLDCDTGRPVGGPCIRAFRTVTFVAKKRGFDNPASREFTGEVFIADIGVPEM